MTSPDHNTDHMAYLTSIALGDVRVLEEKEATYQGSWKRSGGRSAWFMVRRMMDRLLVMLAPPAPPHEWSPADLGDLLSDSKDGDDVTLDHSIIDYLWQSHRAEDIFAMIRQGPGGEDGTVLAVLRDLRRYLILVEAEMVSRGVVYLEKTRLGGLQERLDRPLRVDVDETVPSLGSTEVVGDKKVDPSTPWAVSWSWIVVYLSPQDRELYYHRRAPDVFVLEPVVDMWGLERAIPKELSHLYGLLADVGNTQLWVLDISRCPPGDRDCFPFLDREVNAKVHGELPRWQQVLYLWHEDETKFRLHPDFQAWARQ